MLFFTSPEVVEAVAVAVGRQVIGSAPSNAWLQVVAVGILQRREPN